MRLVCARPFPGNEFLFLIAPAQKEGLQRNSVKMIINSFSVSHDLTSLSIVSGLPQVQGFRAYQEFKIYCYIKTERYQLLVSNLYAEEGTGIHGIPNY